VRFDTYQPQPRLEELVRTPQALALDQLTRFRAKRQGSDVSGAVEAGEQKGCRTVRKR
jgi:hypothetical protein